jgi:hypothetical protein
VPRALSLALIAASFGAISEPARAQDECGKSVRRWVAVELPDSGWSPELARSVLADLRVELGRHGALVCPADTQGLPAPIVTMTLEATPPASVRLALDIIDPATGKPSARELDLASIPADGHSLAVAVAADELLTSSWIKLASRPGAAPPRPLPPAEGTASAAPPPARQRSPGRNELAVIGAAERHGGATWNPGMDLALRRWLSPRWALELAAGARMSIEETATHGRVRSRAFPLALRVLAGIVPFATRVRAGGAAALEMMPLALRAEPDAAAVGVSQNALANYARGELWADVAFGSFRLRALLGAGLPLRSVSADDAGVAVAGARGLELCGQVGLGVGF